MKIWIYILLATCLFEFLEFRNTEDAPLILGIPIIIINLPSFYAKYVACIAYVIYRVIQIKQSRGHLNDKYSIGYVLCGLFTLLQLYIIFFGI